ncbi:MULTISPECIES: nicotinate-nucleotide adenylyltransferase [Anaerostipes]|uniref:nicotinate-nucleotide adenylyltransferase n=1 Tax=Anaerostipes TaxID=207244 RepID=UPI000951B271|nr:MULTISPECIES: nicotinate-nucleotide adenylyltransferase [Anaerostipes]MCI5624236.1 nicotinate-nucleotide adenylyltransferase [Anaerostipes sp.]MDY2726874.1 nicotinate-nucleotide adenylyltransferase [Anaerostipes faecalis]OLR58683.1 nicotinate (nicotinamide) nucleotide adenylyltransferase [Anaerostipes sp. 494a]
MKKIGILGGTFNPIHFGHLILGQSAKEEFGLDKILVMPTKNPAYKTISGSVTEQNRTDMIKLAIKDFPFFEFSDLELRREGTTYTVDTLKELTKQNPDSKYYFIMGADSLYQIETWKDPDQIFSMANILVATRNDSRSALDAQIDYLEDKYDGKIYHLNSPSIEISSHEIRKRNIAGQSIHFFLPESIIGYIERNGLYEHK